MLRSSLMHVMPENIVNDVMAVYETHLKCGLRIPLSNFLLRLC